MTAKDVIKSKVYEQFAGGTGITFNSVVFILILACIIGIYIFGVYKLMSKAAFYSKDLNITIAGVVVVIAAIMIAMQSSLIVSLGMVGSLSIVRFRNAVKNPLDLLFLFWAVSSGILCGVGLSLLVVVLCIVMTVLIMILNSIPNAKASQLLVIRANNAVNLKEIKEEIKEMSKNYKEKSQNISKYETELIVELNCKDVDLLLEKLNSHEGLNQINILSHDGEYRI